MSFTFEQFRTNFRGYPVPPILEDLFLFQSVSPERYAGGFELSEISSKDIQEHVIERFAPQFLGIGQDANFSIYALWIYEHRDLDTAPVVYFNSEGEGSTILANTIVDFLTLLAWDEEPILGVYEENESDIKHTLRNQEFRAWMQMKYQLLPVVHPNTVVQKARLLHPALPLNYSV